MPTTTEVEARLRRTAVACEPLVDDLMTDAPGPSPITVAARRRRGPTPWLAAAALIVALAVAAVVALAASDDPESDVLAEEGTTTAPPASSSTTTPYAPRGVEVMLPDRTHLDVEVPDPGRWSRWGTQSLATVEGLEQPVVIDTDEGTLAQVAEHVGATPVITDLRPGVSLVRGSELGLLVLERDGWTVSMTVAAAGNPGSSVPPEVVDELAAGFDVTMTPLGPVDITAPGLTLRSVTQLLEGEPVTGGDETSTLSITRDVGEATSCPDDLDRAAGRCIAGFHVVALGPRAVEDLPDVEIHDLADGPPVGATSAASLELRMLDGSTIDLGLPEDRDWDATPASAEITMAGASRPLTVEVHRGTVESWTAENDSPIEPTGTPGVISSTLGDSRVMVVDWPDDLLAVVLVQQHGEAVLTPEAEQRLGETLVAVPEVGWISGGGIDVVSTTSHVLAAGTDREIALRVVVGAAATEMCTTPASTVRCSFSDQVAVRAETPEDGALLDGTEVGFSPIG